MQKMFDLIENLEGERQRLWSPNDNNANKQISK